MKLIDYCNKITGALQNQISNERIGRRIMRPEYSLDQVEVKTFPRSYKEGIFLLCWKLGQGGNLSD
ncbi:MAG: hypothetical protein K0S04_2746 [Herbinix sp.]|nr:hypothetical protein [Herbinix sp.]